VRLSRLSIERVLRCRLFLFDRRELPCRRRVSGQRRARIDRDMARPPSHNLPLPGQSGASQPSSQGRSGAAL